MKTRITRYFGFIAVISAVLFGTAGCTSSGGSSSADTTASIHQLSTDISRGHSELGLTVASLKDLLKNPQPDLRKQYATFSDNVNTLGKTAAKVEKTTQELALKKDAFLTKWNAELDKIQDAGLRKKGAKRQASIVEDFKEVAKQYDEVKADFTPVMSKLRDIQTALGADLTTNGLKTVSGIAEDAEDDAQDLNKSFEKLVAKFKELGASLEPVTPPPAK